MAEGLEGRPLPMKYCKKNESIYFRIGYYQIFTRKKDSCLSEVGYLRGIYTDKRNDNIKPDFDVILEFLLARFWSSHIHVRGLACNPALQRLTMCIRSGAPLA